MEAIRLLQQVPPTTTINHAIKKLYQSQQKTSSAAASTGNEFELNQRVTQLESLYRRQQEELTRQANANEMLVQQKAKLQAIYQQRMQQINVALLEIIRRQQGAGKGMNRSYIIEPPVEESMAVPDVHRNSIRGELRSLQNIICESKDFQLVNALKQSSPGISQVDQAFVQNTSGSQPELRDTSFFAAELKNCCDEPSKEMTLSHMERLILAQQDQSYGHDVQLEDLMRISFNKKKRPNDSSLSIKFGDCSAVAGVLSDKSLNFDEPCVEQQSIEDDLQALEEASNETSLDFCDKKDISAIKSDFAQPARDDEADLIRSLMPVVTVFAGERKIQFPKLDLERLNSNAQAVCEQPSFENQTTPHSTEQVDLCDQAISFIEPDISSVIQPKDASLHIEKESEIVPSESILQDLISPLHQQPAPKKIAKIKLAKVIPIKPQEQFQSQPKPLVIPRLSINKVLKPVVLSKPQLRDCQNQSEIIKTKYQSVMSDDGAPRMIKKLNLKKQPRDQVSNSVCMPRSLKIKATQVAMMKKKFVVRTPV